MTNCSSCERTGMTAPVSEGDRFSYSRVFTESDFEAFADLSNDRGEHHFETDDGRVMVHGLLTATLPTKIGSDLNYVARRMEFEFVKPVYTGEEVECVLSADRVTEQEEFVELEATGKCTNEAGEIVLQFETAGVIFT